MSEPSARVQREVCTKYLQQSVYPYIYGMEKNILNVAHRFCLLIWKKAITLYIQCFRETLLMAINIYIASQKRAISITQKDAHLALLLFVLCLLITDSLLRYDLKITALLDV